MTEFYTNNPRNLHQKVSDRKLTKKQRRTEIINNLTNCIDIENKKVGHGNKELMAKLQDKIDILMAKK
tara:strand:+ start:622 stop:825 length:204 start_codon:yes stop_codon:yes gene_type:complete